jgi:hypothetical protein
MNDINKVLGSYREQMHLLVLNADHVPSLIPSWTPAESTSEEQKTRISNLAIPAVGGAPSLLLHDLGEERMGLDKERDKHISNVFSLDKSVCVRNSTRLSRLVHLDAPDCLSTPPAPERPACSSMAYVVIGASISLLIKIQTA